jgi:hypothetical protein
MRTAGNGFFPFIVAIAREKEDGCGHRPKKGRKPIGGELGYDFEVA